MRRPNVALRGWASLIVVSLAMVGVVFAATQASGRTASRSEVNDGGAWLLRRSSGQIGHVNRAVGEVTAALGVADPGTEFDVHQAPHVIVVHRPTAEVISLIDDRSNQALGDVAIPQGATIVPVDGGVVVSHGSTGRVWQLPRRQLLEISSLQEVQPIAHGLAGPVRVAVHPDGTIALRDESTAALGLVGEEGTLDEPVTAPVPTADGFTLVGRHPIVLDADGVLFRRDQKLTSGLTDGTVLQQPGQATSNVVAVDPSGAVTSISLVDGSVEVIGSMPPGGVLAPINHAGCAYAVSTDNPTLVRICGDDLLTVPIAGASSSLRIRLVNGWVWVNDINSGSAWALGPDTDLVRIDDWAQVLPNKNDDPDQEGNLGGDEELRQDPDAADAELDEADRLDDDGQNEPPIAVDDEASTRLERPVVVEVLVNDSDPDGDVIVVSLLSNLPDGHTIVPTAARNAIQVTPQSGFSGPITFSYTITDSMGASDTANVTVDVNPASAELNRPPTPVTDVAATRPGAPAALNVLDNDTDPDGDSLVLVNVVGEGGGIRWTPDGEVVFVPDTAGSDAQIELEYTVVDEYNEEATGRILVNIRLEESNQKPDARNDSALGVEGRPVTLNVLDNDTDADGDALFVSARPVLVAPSNGVPERLSLAADGSFFFVPPTPGTWVFTYSVSDGPDADQAQIRIDVEGEQPNRPPVAVRDDIVIPVGATRVVNVLENDGDPDGDVVSVVETLSGDDGLQIEEIPGIGYRITTLASATDRAQFRYAISDGLSEPVTAAVVVSIPRGLDITDQAPVTRPDVVEIRAGRTTSIPVLLNDFDPEGGVLTVVDVTDGPSGTTTEVDSSGQRLVVSLPLTQQQGFVISYSVEDDAGNRSGAQVRVRIVFPDEPNRPPEPQADVARTIEGSEVIVNVLINDFDPDGDTLVVASITEQPVNGSAEVLPDGTISYQPRLGTAGTDRFSYSVTDTEGDSAVADVLVGVMPRQPANRPPNAVDDGPVDFDLGGGSRSIDVRLNDTDPDNDRLQVIDVEQPRLGSVEIADGGGLVTYTPPDALPDNLDSVTTTFRYTISDGRDGTDSATVSIELTDAPDPVPPVAVDDSAGPVAAGSSVTLDVVANDGDPDGRLEDLSVSATSPDVTVQGQSLVIVAPAASAQYRYTITDNDGLTASATVSLTVVPNQPPEITTFTSDVEHETAFPINLTGQASDPDGDSLLFVCCDSAQGGSAQISSQGLDDLHVVFTPDPGFSGPAGFSYTVDDQNGHVISGPVVLTVLPPANESPVAGDGAADVEQGGVQIMDLDALITDPDRATGDTFTFSASPPAGVALNGSTLEATVDVATSVGTKLSVDYAVTDSFGESDTGTVVFTVIPTSVPIPEANTDSYRLLAGVSQDVDPLINDSGTGLVIVSASSSQGATVQVINGGTGLRLTPIEGFSGSTTADYRIQDEFNDASREQIGQLNIDVVGLPVKPTPPQGTSLLSGECPLTWTTPAGNGAPIEEYELNHDQGGGPVSVGNVNGYNWIGLTNGTDYRFSLRARNEAGWSEWSDPSGICTPDIVPGRPSAPNILFADQALDVAWTAPPNTGSAIDDYELEIGGGRSSVQPVGTQTSYTWPGLSNGAGYQFRVRAHNGAGWGEWSTWSATEHPLREPDAPAAPTVQRGQQFLDITWPAPADNGDPISNYEIRIAGTGQTFSTGNGSTTSHRWSNLTNGVLYSFEVRAENRAGWGLWGPGSADEKPCDVPDAVGAPSGTAGDQQVTVNWSGPNDQGCAISSYKLHLSPTTGGSPRTVAGGTTSLVVSGLNNGTDYTFWIEAINEEGSSAQGATGGPFRPMGLPIGPSSASASPGVRQITVSWSAADANGGGNFGYEVSFNGGSTWESAGTSTSFVKNGLTNGVTYNVRVRATNEVGNGPVASAGAIKVWDTPPPTGPPSASAGNARATVNWNTPENGGTALTRVEVDIDPGTSWAGNPTTSHTFTGLSNGTGYRFRVRYQNAVGWGGWSAWSNTVTPQAPPALSANFTVEHATLPGSFWISLTATNFSPNTSYTLTCSDSEPNFWSQPATTNGAGGYTDTALCFTNESPVTMRMGGVSVTISR